MNNVKLLSGTGLRSLAVAALVGALVGTMTTLARAAGSDSYGVSNTTAAISKSMRGASALIKRQDFAAALPLLKKEVAANPDNADAWNLTGYASRKLGDYAASEKAYDRALALDPKHLGALEYKGELYLTLGNLAGAEDMLKRLRSACSFNCGEVKDLAKAIRAYKASN